MSNTELLPYNGLADHSEIQCYQRVVGSVIHAAVNTRPNVAFAVSRLARFLSNPGRAHQEAIDGVLNYLASTEPPALWKKGAHRALHQLALPRLHDPARLVGLLEITGRQG